MEPIILGIKPITLQQFYDIITGKYQVCISKEATEKIIQSRNMVDDLIKNDVPVYGITTGFGSLSTHSISSEDIDLLQINLIRSHAVGIGPAAPKKVVRGMLLLRLLSILRGRSCVRLVVANTLVNCLNKNFIPFVPNLGTVGASGDLAPLSHMILALIGEGLNYNETTKKYVNSLDILKEKNIEPYKINHHFDFISCYRKLKSLI